MIISRTPTRVSFLGGGTDYPSWWKKNGGIVVGGAINKYSFVSGRYLPPYHNHKTRVVYSEIETVHDNSEIAHRAIKASLEYLDCKEGVELFHASDLPSRSGTGSSSTFVVGLLHTLKTMQGRTWWSKTDLADAAIDIEQNKMGETVGCQDQLWAAHGGVNIIKFRPSGETVVYPLAINAEKIEMLEEHLLLMFTKIVRTSSEVAKSYAPSLGERSKEQWAMMRLAEEGIDAIYNSNYEKLGQLIDTSWRIKSGLSSQVSSEEIAKAYINARLAGAFGGKLIGAGGGGCLLLVVPPEKRQAIKAALPGYVHVPFRFDSDGSVIIFINR